MLYIFCAALSLSSSAAPWWIGMSLLIQLTGGEDSCLAAAWSYVGWGCEWPNICHLLFILLSSTETGDLLVDGLTGDVNVRVAVYLWSCFALCREGSEVDAVIFGDAASSARRRVSCLLPASPWSPWYEPWPQTVPRLPNKDWERKHLLWNCMGS